MTEFDFSSLGLEPRDRIVYEALYKLDKVSLRTIAQTTGMNRGTVYEVIKKLIHLGLVTFTQIGERRHYSAASPETFVSLIHERRDRLQQLEGVAATYIKHLEARRPVPGAGYFASFYEGDEGVASILRDVLQTVRTLERKEYHVMSSQRVSRFIYNNFKSFSRRRVQEGIFVRVISDGPSSEKVVHAERRLLPVTPETLNGYTLIYGDKTALISIGEANAMSAVVITDAGVANMQRLLFEQIWQGLALPHKR